MARTSVRRLSLESLEDRLAPAIAIFNPSTGVLSVTEYYRSLGNDTVRIEGVNAGIRVTLNGTASVYPADAISEVQIQTGGGDDNITVVGTLPRIPRFTVDGGVGNNTLTLEGAFSIFGHRYKISDSTFSLSSGFSASYSNVSTLQLTADSWDNTIELQGAPANTRVEIDGGGGYDTLIGPGQSSAWSVTRGDGGEVSWAGRSQPIPFNAVESLTGGWLDDSFAFAAGGSLTGSLNGGDALGGLADRLSFLSYTPGVTVDLTAGSAPSVAGGAAGWVTGIENVVGTPGDDTLTGNAGSNYLDGAGGNDVLNGMGGGDVLLGGSGNDTLNGGGEADLLIGGAGYDLLNGDLGDDILIGGSTSYTGALVKSSTWVDLPGAGEAPLRAIVAEWGSGSGYQQRISNIRSGAGLAQGYRLDNTTVRNDFADDDLWGGEGADWFWGDGSGVYYLNSLIPTLVRADRLRDMVSGEVNR